LLLCASDLSKGQLADLQSGGANYASIPASSPAPAAAPAPSSGGDRWSSYSRGSSSSGGSAPARGGSGKLSAGDLSSFKIVDLVEIAGKRGVSAGRNPTRETLTDGLVKAGEWLLMLCENDAGVTTGGQGQAGCATHGLFVKQA
jgi:hypothetical protein